MKDNMDYSEDSDVESVDAFNVKKVTNIQFIFAVFKYYFLMTGI
jgi:hypothetical protein